MGSTPVYQLPWPELPDDANGPDGYQDLAVAAETAIKTQADAVKAASNFIAQGARQTYDAVPPGVWGNAIAQSWEGTPAGRYLITGLLNWGTDAVQTAVYSYMRLTVESGTNPAFDLGYRAFSGYVRGTDQSVTSVIIDAINHPGGHLGLSISYGFSSNNIIACKGTRVTAVRIS
jgi:hypothetical protein